MQNLDIESMMCNWQQQWTSDKNSKAEKKKKIISNIALCVKVGYWNAEAIGVEMEALCPVQLGDVYRSCDVR